MNKAKRISILSVAALMGATCVIGLGSMRPNSYSASAEEALVSHEDEELYSSSDIMPLTEYDPSIAIPEYRSFIRLNCMTVYYFLQGDDANYMKISRDNSFFATLSALVEVPQNKIFSLYGLGGDTPYRWIYAYNSEKDVRSTYFYLAGEFIQQSKCRSTNSVKSGTFPTKFDQSSNVFEHGGKKDYYIYFTACYKGGSFNSYVQIPGLGYRSVEEEVWFVENGQAKKVTLTVRTGPNKVSIKASEEAEFNDYNTMFAFYTSAQKIED